MHRKTADVAVFNSLSYIVTFFAAMICLVPFWLIVVGSFSSEKDILLYGYAFWPRNFSLGAYQLVFEIPQRIIHAYGVSGFITVVGGGLSLFLTAVTAFVIMRKDFKYRNGIALFFYIPSVFSGGMIPTYILVVMYLGLRDNIWALILPALLSSWNIFLMRNFMKGIPDSIMESAKIDGANDFLIFIRLYLPLSGAGLATIGLFTCLGYWNNWFNAMLYINKSDLFPLQYLLYQILTNAEAMKEAASISGIILQDAPSETFKMATAVIVTGPILLLYPFVQRFFVKGLTVGAVKG